MENFAQNYLKFDIFGTLLYKKGVNQKSLVADLELGKIKPSELIEKDSEINSSTDENDLQDPNANVFDI